MKSLGELRAERESRVSELFKRVGLFFAFSNKQFEENKTPLREGDKYVATSYGGYLPKGNVEEYRAGMREIDEWYDGEIDAANLGDEEIRYELNNHECYYTGDPTDVVEMFEGRYEKERILKIFYGKAV